ncbi:tRNA (guanosine(46)-N7)-methyltransferase TrmB [Helicobacter turcicus]|uniref:tRNA (guanine-N(7)-)-methyltransferase n=1 Tax=Helicobacter turcicus TaxID=2867412 RepID=A0ABS7JKJ5_9HELI|nr:tRNA (guanosine(46)-N7)-methyltransferase TrmB [Helicobacter turcicus]MBX7489920.1 tRNA (guanosine(46)-N7)-methyltransferase TrmB [Helicobacter turcicus]MBX7544780.1 tRNA (guanosine(46)-N7)-methyltransferase TrmB [Helicobacter turcicus]
MPHFKTPKLTLPNLPYKATHSVGEFEFLELFTSKNNPNFSLLQIRFTPKDSAQIKEFFLEIKRSENTILVRFDKYSRIAPIEIIKNALEILSQMQDSILTHNLNRNTITLEYKLPFIKEINDFLDFSALFNRTCAESKRNFSNIWLEIGFGSGRHLLHNANQNPNILHIGLEIHHPSLEQVARQIGIQKLDNILILAFDARIFLELLPSNILDKIFVHFPVPWDKKPNRRIFSQAFITQSARVLKQDGHLQLRTDSLEYFTFVKELMKNFKESFKIESQKNTKETIISKYEARWLRQQKDIYNLECFALQTSKERVLDFDFIFDSAFTHKDFKPRKFIQKDYFLNLEDIFLGQKSNLLRIAFGDFNYPETRYIIQDSTLHYFRSNPLPSAINHKAHNLLKAYITKNCKESL